MISKNKITKIKNKLVAAMLFATLFCFALGAGISAVHAVSHHSSISHQAKDFHHCTICSFSNSQNQILAASDLVFVAAAFYFLFTLRFFNRVKLSYLTSSKHSRAPPFSS